MVNVDVVQGDARLDGAERRGPPAAGQRTNDDGDDDADLTPVKRARLVVDIDGFNLDATRTVREGDHDGRERSCRNLLRAPLSLERLSIDESGNARDTLRNPIGTPARTARADERAHSGAALVPPTSIRLPCAATEAPQSHRSESSADPCALADDGRDARSAAHENSLGSAAGALHLDGLRCARCGATMQVVAIVRNRDEARRYLEGTGQYSTLPATRWMPP